MPAPPFEQMLQQLLSINSISSFDKRWDTGNIDVITLLANWLEPLGFHCEIQVLKGQPHKANLIATLGTGSGGLVLAGHTDTVPYDENGWQYDALGMTNTDNRFYGLGSCDMKGFFAVVIDAIKDIVSKPPKEPIIIIATADEESSMAGAEALAAAGNVHGRYAIIGEPTNLQAMTKHKSITMQRIAIQGQSGHSSNPDLGYSALEVMHELTADLLSYRKALQQKFKDPSFKVVHPTMNMGCIHGGDSANRICSHCTLDFDARLLPSMSNKQLLQDIHKIIEKTQDKHPVNITLEPLFKGIDPFYQASDHEFVKTVERLSGQEPGSVAFATEAPYFKSMGFETVVMGPGSIDQAHQPNEYLAHDTIKPAQEIIRSLIKRYCY